LIIKIFSYYIQSHRFEKNFQITEIGPLQLWRHFVQLMTFVFLNGKVLGIASTGIIVPFLWHSGSPFSTVHGAFDSLEYTLSRGAFPLIVLGVIFLTSVTVGRVFCGWACPMGMIQDFLSYLPFQKERLSPATVSSLRDLKWVILGFSLIVSSLVGINRPLPGTEATLRPIHAIWETPFTVFSPSSTLFAYLPWMLIWNPNVLAQAGAVGWVKFMMLIAVLVPSIYVPRFFCRFFCPMGALLEPLSPFKMLRISKSSKLQKEELNSTLRDVCPMEVQVSEENAKFISEGGCITCGKCISEYPVELSLSLN